MPPESANTVACELARLRWMCHTQGDKYGSRPISELDVTAWEVLQTACNPSAAAALSQTLLWKLSASLQGYPSTSVISRHISEACMISPAALAGCVNMGMCVLCRDAAPHTCACRLITPSRFPATGRRTWASSGTDTWVSVTSGSEDYSFKVCNCASAALMVIVTCHSGCDVSLRLRKACSIQENQSLDLL